MEIEGVPGTEDEPDDSHFHDQYYDGVGDDESVIFPQRLINFCHLVNVM